VRTPNYCTQYPYSHGHGDGLRLGPESGLGQTQRAKRKALQHDRYYELRASRRLGLAQVESTGFHSRNPGPGPDSRWPERRTDVQSPIQYLIPVSGMVWYGMVPLLPPGPQSLRPGGGSWIGRRLSMLRLRPFRPRLFGDGFRFHRDRRER
jgi:hypothetical protein